MDSTTISTVTPRIAPAAVFSVRVRAGFPFTCMTSGVRVIQISTPCTSFSAADHRAIDRTASPIKDHEGGQNAAALIHGKSVVTPPMETLCTHDAEDAFVVREVMKFWE